MTQFSHVPPPNPPPAPFLPPQRVLNIPGLIGMISSIVGLLGLCLAPFFVFSIAGLIVSIFGMRRPDRGMAIAGLVMGIIGTILLFITIVIVLIAIVAAASEQAVIEKTIVLSLAFA